MSVHRVRRKRLPRWVSRALLLLLVLAWTIFTLAPRFGNSESQVFVAKHLLLSGQKVTIRDLETKNLELGEIGSLYLKPGDLSGEFIVLRDTAPGELIAVTGVRATNFDMVPLALQLDQPISRAIKAGSAVSIWAAPGRFSERQEAQQIASGARVSEVRVRTSMNRTTVTLEIWLDASLLAPILLAQSDGSIISVVLEPSLGDAK